MPLTPLMPAMRARKPHGDTEPPWGQLFLASVVIVVLVLLGTGRITIAPSILSRPPANTAGGSNPALRWADHPPSLALSGQLPHWLGATARPPGSRQLEDGPLLNDLVPFSSQAVGGDAWLYRTLFHGKRHGFFVEVGAGSGGGASRWLQVAAGWHGMLIEGDDGAYRQLSLSRPDAICLHAVVCGGRFSTVHWATRLHQTGSISSGGIWELMPADKRQALGGSAASSAEGLPTAQCIPLHYFLDKFGILAVDLLTINVAGAELEVLRGLDLSRLAVKVLAVGQSGGSIDGISSDSQQASNKTTAIADWLTQAGFEAAPTAVQTGGQQHGGWAVFVNSQLRHHLQSAPEA